MKKKKNELMSTYEREMQDPEFKKAFEEEYMEFTLQELLLAISEGMKSLFALSPKKPVCTRMPFRNGPHNEYVVTDFFTSSDKSIHSTRKIFD